MGLPHATADQLQRVRAQVAAEKPEWGDAQTRIPVERYFSPAIREAEVSHLFRRLPLIAAHASELAPGQALAHDTYGVPILLTRDAQGEVRAFLNVCRHRGMRLVDGASACDRASVVCPYHGWAYRLDGKLRHMLHPTAFDACEPGERDLVALPCAERHGLVWVVPDPQGRIDLDEFLGGLDDELPFCEIESLQLYRSVEADFDANWKLIVDAFLEPYHIRVLHRDTIYPFFTDGITAAQRFGPHISSLVARRASIEWAHDKGLESPATFDAMRQLVTPSQVIFPNTITIFHPDYLSLISVYPTGPEKLHWTHRMLIPKERSTPDWAPHWEKTFQLVEHGVFQKEDIACAVGIQRGLKTGANRYVTAGRMEQALGWFHESVRSRIGC